MSTPTLSLPSTPNEKATHFLLDQEWRRHRLHGKASKAKKVEEMIHALGWETTEDTEQRLETERLAKIADQEAAESGD